ncbi:AAA family ATPase [Enterococcus saccharolyticus]|uniref:ATPase n=1 Tax=Candidatus Enterococcus willemsii TaxID=1857215 RepID=A0ABQ6YYT3_9ENTE|nr:MULTISPECIES: AAA family ATPase [Enterococcus]KAF1303324.1 ATPase [Enterococcus sp. CU12B]MCD5001705.1 AAA family ATPase [Enterococcus saccharolyticus]
MRYLRGLKLSDSILPGPNIYPYCVLNVYASEHLVFDTITFLYGDNGSGKSTILNLLASHLQLPGAEATRTLGDDYWGRYLKESAVLLDEDDAGRRQKIPENSRYIKSEDILYEIKKIQQEAIQREGYLYERQQLGMTKEQIAAHKDSYAMKQQMARRTFAQEKYSNGETALQVFEDYIQPNGLYLLDEPEASLSPEKQLQLIQQLHHAARFLNVQFIIASHSPLLLGGLEGTIYSFDQEGIFMKQWNDLPVVQLYQDFFNNKR